MRVLDRYIVASLVRHIALSLAVLLVLVAVFLFVNEQGWVGAGRYGQLQALRYVLLQLPATAMQFLPVAAVLGALLAMGQLARDSELTVMRAAGVSVARLAGSVMLAGVLLLPVVIVIGEWLAPPLAEASRVWKARERGDPISVTADAAWIATPLRLVRADPAGALTVFELDAAGRLAAITVAAGTPGTTADQPPPGSRTVFEADRASLAAPDLTGTPVTGAPALLLAARQDPRQQSLRQLRAAIRELHARGADTRRHRFAFAASLARLAAIPLGVLLALPLLLGFLRGSETGARATAALGIGIAYFIAQRLVENGALVFAVPPALLAWMPVVLLGVAVALLSWHVRRLGTR